MERFHRQLSSVFQFKSGRDWAGRRVWAGNQGQIAEVHRKTNMMDAIIVLDKYNRYPQCAPPTKNSLPVHKREVFTKNTAWIKSVLQIYTIVDLCQFFLFFRLYNAALYGHSAKDKVRYRQKLKVAGLDNCPYSITVGWKNEPKRWPDVTYGDIYDYLINTPGKWDLKTFFQYHSIQFLLPCCILSPSDIITHPI